MTGGKGSFQFPTRVPSGYIETKWLFRVLETGKAGNGNLKRGKFGMRDGKGDRFGLRIKLWRDRAVLSQRRLASLLRVSHTTLGKIERGEMEPGHDLRTRFEALEQGGARLDADASDAEFALIAQLAPEIEALRHDVGALCDIQRETSTALGQIERSLSDDRPGILLRALRGGLTIWCVISGLLVAALWVGLGTQGVLRVIVMAVSAIR